MTKMLLTLAGILFATFCATTSQCHAGNVVVNLSEEGILTIQSDAETNNLHISIAEDTAIGGFGGPVTFNGEAGPVRWPRFYRHVFP